jgi:voltage-gated potassium channel
MDPFVRRVFLALATVGGVILVGGWVLFVLGKGQWSLGDGIYMAAISAATVGFSELPHFDEVVGARFVTIIIIMLGIGAFTFFQSSLTAFFVEGALGEAIRRRRMDNAIAALKDHVVVAGCGSTGRHVIGELLSTRTPFVVVDRDKANLDLLNDEIAEGKLLYILGDATHDHTLAAARIAEAKGLIAALTHDRDNLYVTLSARSLNPKARIVAKVVEREAVPKMIRAGANATVSPNTIGGIRMASELIRPSVVEFLDLMLRDKEKNLRIEEAVVPDGSHLIGLKLKDAPIHEDTNTLLMALREPQGVIRYNPSRDITILSGTVLIVMGEVKDIVRLREYVKPGRGSVLAG